MMSGNRKQALNSVISWALLIFHILFKSPVMGGNISCLLNSIVMSVSDPSRGKI